jgi:excisionase family DNA binding protein
MHRHLQFDMPENPASDRRHGSGLAAEGTGNRDRLSKENQLAREPSRNRQYPLHGSVGLRHAALPHAATEVKKDNAAEHSSISIPDARQSEEKPHSFEPLIGSCEAAKLLGNIHVKTLQRYARQGNVPGYQIGGHWYFRASELDSWLRSRINSTCHPCRSN